MSYGRELFRTHQVSQATCDAALAQFGVRGLIELTNLMGYYARLAFNSNAFGVELPPRSPKRLVDAINFGFANLVSIDRMKQEITDTPHAPKGAKPLNNFVVCVRIERDI
jgi:hypothetical protein